MISSAVIGNALVWVLFGAVVGLIVHLINGNRIRGGIMTSLGLGIFGSLLGGFISTALFGKSMAGFSIPGIFTATIGGAILTVLARILFRESHHIKTSRTYLRRGEVK